MSRESWSSLTSTIQLSYSRVSPVAFSWVCRWCNTESILSTPPASNALRPARGRVSSRRIVSHLPPQGNPTWAQRGTSAAVAAAHHCPAGRGAGRAQRARLKNQGRCRRTVASGRPAATRPGERDRVGSRAGRGDGVADPRRSGTAQPAGPPPAATRAGRRPTAPASRPTGIRAREGRGFCWRLTWCCPGTPGRWRWPPSGRCLGPRGPPRPPNPVALNQQGQDR